MIKNKKIYSFKKLNILFIIAIILAIFLVGCGYNCKNCEKGDKGDPGKDGIDGATGPAGPAPVIIVPDEINDIQQGIDSLINDGGGTVYIKAGEYTLSQGIHINSSNITIIGEQGTLIKLGNHVNEPVILIGSDEEIPTTSIENIKIETIELDGNKDFQDFETDPNRPWIRNNCIDIRMANDIWINGVDVHNARSGGLVVSWNSRFIFIDKSSFHHNFFDGIALYASENIWVSNFSCYENDAAGLSLDNDLKNVVFTSGIVKNNGDVGLFVRHSNDLSFHGIIFTNNQSHGCFLSHESIGTDSGVTRLFFNSCSFIDNNGYGFWLASPASESPNNTVVGCLFSGNTQGAIELDINGELYQDGNVFQ
jgi:hypothetical protein